MLPRISFQHFYTDCGPALYQRTRLIIGGFRASELHLLDAYSIPAAKLAPSLPLSQDNNQGTCSSTSLAQVETPLRTELRHFFVKKLAITKDTTAPKSKHRRVHIEGEALTNDEVIEWLKMHEGKKNNKGRRVAGKGKSKGKRKRQADESTANDDTEDCEDEKDTTHCFTCGGTYSDGEEDQWVGCDDCYSW